jgi:hypothetical protein
MGLAGLAVLRVFRLCYYAQLEDAVARGEAWAPIRGVIACRGRTASDGYPGSCRLRFGIGWSLKVRQDRSRLTGLIALMAMAVLLAAVPVHHVHMLLAALERPSPVVASMNRATRQVLPGARAPVARAMEHGSHGDAGHRSRADAHHSAARASGVSAQKQDDRPIGDMARCPICSTVTAAGVPPPLGSELARVDGRELAPSVTDAGTLPTFHFGPVRARAPPISG